MRFTREKAGPYGKVELCQWLNIGTIIDDEDEVAWEAEQKGFPYLAIRTRRQPHNWANETYPNLPAAVEAFLRTTEGMRKAFDKRAFQALTKGFAARQV